MPESSAKLRASLCLSFLSHPSAPGAGLVLFFRVASSLLCQDLAKPSQCPVRTCTSTNSGTHRAPSPSCRGGRSSILSPQQQKCPQMLLPLPRTPLRRSLKAFPEEGFPERRLPGQESSHPDHSNTEGSPGDQTPSLAAFKGGRGSAKSRGCLSQHAASSSSSPPSF